MFATGTRPVLEAMSVMTTASTSPAFSASTEAAVPGYSTSVQRYSFSASQSSSNRYW